MRFELCGEVSDDEMKVNEGLIAHEEWRALIRKCYFRRKAALNRCQRMEGQIYSGA